MHGESAPRVFVSHSSHDTHAAGRICRCLEDYRIGCWIAPRDVPPGADYAECILGAIEQSDACLLLLSVAANRSRHVRNEIERVVSKNKAVVPVRLEPVLPQGSLELHLASCQWIDAFGQELEDCLPRLVRCVQALLDGSRGVPPRTTPASDGAPSSSDHGSAHRLAESPAWTGGRIKATPGSICGSRVMLRREPSVSAEVLRILALGDAVEMLDHVSVASDREAQLAASVTFTPRHGPSYRIPAGMGVTVAGEVDDGYLVELSRPGGRDVGYVPKHAVRILRSSEWCRVRRGSTDGWVLARYVARE